MGTAVVIGGGPNGIASAITLAGRGHDVTLVEARSELGGRTEVLADTRTVQPWAVKSLGLRIEWSASSEWVGADDSGVRASIEGLPSVVGWRKEVERFGALIRTLSASAAPNIRTDAAWTSLVGPAMHALKLGRSNGLELARVGPLCAEDWLDEWSIPRDAQATLVAPALTGTWMGPKSPTSALAVLFYAALSGRSVAGGMKSLQAALIERLAGTAVSVRTGAAVTRIGVDSGRVTGVTLADGATLDADIVVSTVGPKATLLGLVSPRTLPVGVDQTVQNIRTRGIVAVFKATVTTPFFGGAERVVLAADTVAIERAFDDAKHRRLPTQPTLVVHQDAGNLVIHVFGAAHDLDAGWSADTATALQATVVQALSAHGDAGELAAATLLTPADLEREYGLDGGHLFHGEFAIDQFLSFRPHPSLTQYRTAVEGLFLGGAGMHPAGGFTLAQGVLAARSV